MLKIIAIGNLTRDVELKMDKTTGIPYAILRIASDRRYRDREGNKIADFISAKVRGPLAERCAAFAYKGCKHRVLRGPQPPARFPHQGQRGGVPIPQAGGRRSRCPPRGGGTL